MSLSSVSYIQPSSFLQLVLRRQFSLQLKRLESTSFQRKASSQAQVCDPPAGKTTSSSGISAPKSHMAPSGLGYTVPSNWEH